VPSAPDHREIELEAIAFIILEAVILDAVLLRAAFLQTDEPTRIAKVNACS
jgi:hypothetical protein